MATTKVRPGGWSTSTAPADRLLDVKEAAAILAVKPATLYQWAYLRRIPFVKLFGRRGALRFRLSDIERLIAGSVRPATPSTTDAA
jgi:excisionase family DNA binding protein